MLWSTLWTFFSTPFLSGVPNGVMTRCSVVPVFMYARVVDGTIMLRAFLGPSLLACEVTTGFEKDTEPCGFE